MQRAFRRHEEIVRSAMIYHGGFVFKMIGDAFQVAFAAAKDAVLAALEAQQNLHNENWGGTIPEIKVRMALHTGVTEERGDDYLGPALNRVARLLNAGHGGQVLLTEAVYLLVRDELPAGINLQYLGEHHLKDLIQPERVYQVASSGLSLDFPPLRTESAPMRTLPFQSTPFIGREAELARIGEMLSDPACRLVTLLGIGGSGKTRLAVRAAQLYPQFKDGITFCALENVDTGQGLILAIAESMNLAFNSLPGRSISAENAREQLFQYLVGKHMLLVLDNFEQLSLHAEMVDDLLSLAPEIKIIVTSRQRLNLPGEWVIEVGGLLFPDNQSNEPLSGFSAIQLFVETAERNSSFHPQPGDWHAILKICRLLEGIPLGLEMAAALTRTISCAEIAEEIERNQDFLSTSWRGMPERHQTLRAVFDHSWRLLSGVEQDVFSRLSIFRGGFTREAAQVVAGAPLPMVSSLVDKALIRKTSSARFEIHPLLRRYASEKLSANPGLLDETCSRMADYHTDWLIRMFQKMKGDEYLIGLDAIRLDIANLTVSLEWMSGKVDVERLSRAFPAWILYHVMNDQRFEMQEASRLIVDLISRLRPRISTMDSLDAVLLALACATIRFFCGDYSESTPVETYFKESMRLISDLPDHINKAYALLVNSINQGFMSVPETVDSCLQANRIFDRLGERWGSAMGYLVLGDTYTFAALNPDEARAAYAICMREFTRLRSEWGRALCTSGLMFLESKVANQEQAYQLGTTCLEFFAEMANFERMVGIRQELAEISIKLGYIQQAREFIQANLAHFTRRGDEAGKQDCQQRLAELTGK